MGKIVVVRHGDKQYANGHSQYKKFDPPLREDCLDTIKNKFHRYVEKYDAKPTKIISSPFLRCRQTSQVICELTSLDMKIEREVGEFLGFQKKVQDDDFYQETREWNPYIGENKEEYRERVSHYMRNIEDNLGEDECVWIVCHGFFIYQYILSKKMKTWKARPFSGIIVENGKVNVLSDR